MARRPLAERATASAAAVLVAVGLFVPAVATREAGGLKAAYSSAQYGRALAAQPASAGSVPVGPAMLARFRRRAPPPSLDPWADGQPADTGLGSYLVSHLTDESAPNPLPSQSTVDIATACPLLLDWPSRLEVDAPDTCHSLPVGAWSSPGGVLGGGTPLLTWRLTCWLQAPRVTYTMPNGDIFGNSHSSSMFFDSTVVLYDCRENPRYSIQEKIYKEVGQVDPQACQKYKACDGAVWLQYFIYNYIDGQTIAKTPYLRLFQDSFDILDMEGTVVAKVSRQGGWNPTCGECGEQRKWAIEYQQREKPGAFSSPTDQWPIAEMVTILAIRDSNRRPTGLVAPSLCEFRSFLLQIMAFILLVMVLCTGLVLLLWFAEPTREYLFRLEERVCPIGTRIPSKL